jgi:hypothetical protein
VGYTYWTMSDITAEIEALIRDFTSRVVTATHVQVGERLLAVVAAALTESVPAPNPGRPAPKDPSVEVATGAPRKRKLSAKGLAVRKLQGRYLGALRGLRPGARARVKKVAREKDVAAALKLASSLK